MRSRRFVTAFAALGAGIFAASCGIIAGVDRGDIPQKTDGRPPTSGAGGAVGSCDPNLCPGDDGDCRVRACDQDGQCSFDNFAPGEPCSDASNADAKLCNGMGDCVACLSATDCDPVLEACLNGECVPASCSDGVRNQSESDVDCGGLCRGCGIGMGCDSAADCASDSCDTSGGGAGGSGGAAVGGGGGTGGNGGSGGAGGGGLAPAAGVCVGKLQGKPCGGAGECEAALTCSDGFCCDSACSGDCESCAAADSGGTNGVCAPFSKGGLGKAMTCSPYVCDGSATACPTSCMNNPDCAPGFTCTQMMCQ